MKQLTIVCAAVLFFGAALWGANKSANFSGNWKLDPDLSDPAPKTNQTKQGSGGVTGSILSGLSASGLMNGVYIQSSKGEIPFGNDATQGRPVAGSGYGFPGIGGMPGRFGPAVPARPVPAYGIMMPMSKNLEIRQTGDKIQINHKGANNGEDLIETFMLNGKPQVEMAETVKGTRLKQITRIKLSKAKLLLDTQTTLPDRKSVNRKREFALTEGGAILVKETISASGYAISNQIFVYNKE
jgi:hypothetical protein